MKRFFVLLTMLCVLITNTAFAQTLDSITNFEDNYVTVTEMGLPKKGDTNIGAKKAHARKAAILNGYSALIAEVKGIQVTDEMTTEDLAFSSGSVNARLSGVVRNAKIVKEEWNPTEETYTVTLRMPIFGATNSVASAVIPRNEPKQPFMQATSYVQEKGLTQLSHESLATNGNYTGVIIDCRGLDVKRAMSPNIVDETNAPVYGHKNLNPDYIVEHGMVSYSKDINNCPRAGHNPMVLKAVGVKGTSSPRISNADTAKLLGENEVSHFLDNTNVVFVI